VLELVVVTEEDCSDEVDDGAIVIEEVAEDEGGEAWVVDVLGEDVEVAVFCGEVRTYAAPSKTMATTKAAAATRAPLAPGLFKEGPPDTHRGRSVSRRGLRAGHGSQSASRAAAPSL
jgi:hypothetical protein